MGLFLAFGCRSTYCIKKFCVCTLFFCFFHAVIPNFPGGRSLGDKSKGQIPAFFVLNQPFFQLFRPRNHNWMTAPSGDGRHLRVVRRAHDHRLAARFFGLGHDLMDAGDVGAGGIQYLHPTGPELVIDRSSLPVGADDHGAALGHVLRPLHRRQALFGQTGDDILVVDDGAQHHAGPSLLCRPLRQLHRPAYTVAEAGRFG